MPNVQYVGTFFAAAGECFVVILLGITDLMIQESFLLYLLLVLGIATTLAAVSSVVSALQCKLDLETLGELSLGLCTYRLMSHGTFGSTALSPNSV
jgi:hypothetical protein